LENGIRFLLDDFTVSYAPSATVWARLLPSAAGPDSAPAPLLAIGGPADGRPTVPAARETVTDSTLLLFEGLDGLQIGSIPYSAEEVHTISRYGGPGTEVRSGDDATETWIKTSDLSRYRVVHVATHALVSYRSPGRSALVLAPGSASDDGLLQSREIASLRMASDLVVLSACQTARGPVFIGEGVVGLAQAFFTAGARALVASLWNVNDRETVAIMDAFYLELASGRPIDEALQAAKLNARRRGVSPRHWAPFIAIGSAAQSVPLTEPARARAMWAAAVALGLGVLVAVLVRRRLGMATAEHRPPARDRM
jgi:CHAT domain-containing protein